MSKGFRLLGGVAVLAAALLLAGCVRSRGAPQTPTTQGGSAPKPPVGRLKRTIDKPTVMNALHNVGLLYQTYVTDMGKPPAKPEDFLEYIKRDEPKAYQLLKDGHLVLNLKAGTDANQVLCYEKDADLDDSRFVAMRDGNVAQLSTADFDKLLPPKDR